MRSRRAAIWAAATILISGCGGHSERVAPPPPNTHLVGHQKLEAFVPKASGWSAGQVSGADVSLPAPASHVRVTFTKEKSAIDLELTDSGGDPAYVQALSSIAGTSFNQEAPNGYMKGTTVGGFPAVETFNKDDKLGEITILIAGRFVVHASGTGLATISPLQEFVSHVDLNGINALK